MFVVTKQVHWDDGVAHHPVVDYAADDRTPAIAHINRICARHEVARGQVEMVLDMEDGQPRLTVWNPHLPYRTVYRVKEGL